MLTIEAYLTRQFAGDYMLTAKEPIVAIVEGVGHHDVYLQPGEPIGLRHLCIAGVKELFGVKLNRLESIKVRLAAEVLSDAVPLRRRLVPKKADTHETEP